MPAIFPREGTRFVLGLILKTDESPMPPFHVHLFKNNYTPSATTTLGDFVEADFAGYDVPELLRDVWTNPITMAPYAVSQYGESAIEWIASSGAQTVYGYYVTDEGDTTVLWCERWPASVVIGDVVPFAMMLLVRLWDINAL